MANSLLDFELPKTPARVGNNGTPAWRSYAILRRNLDVILEMERHRDKFSENQIARHLGVTRNTYQSIRELLRRRQRSIAEGNWDEVEIELFGRFGSYRDLPFYKKAMAFIENGPPNPNMNVVPTPGKAGRPKGSKNRPKPAAGQGSEQSPAAVTVSPPVAPANPPATISDTPATPATATTPTPDAAAAAASVQPPPAAPAPARPSFFRAPEARRQNVDHLPKAEQMRVEKGGQGELFKTTTPAEAGRKT